MRLGRQLWHGSADVEAGSNRLRDIFRALEAAGLSRRPPPYSRVPVLLPERMGIQVTASIDRVALLRSTENERLRGLPCLPNVRIVQNRCCT
jgi:hypothetical protein